MLTESAAIVTCLGSLNLKWDQPEGGPVNLGYIMPSGGEFRTGRTKGGGAADRWVPRSDGTPFRIEAILDHLPGWIAAIEDFQQAVRKRAQDAER